MIDTNSDDHSVLKRLILEHARERAKKEPFVSMEQDLKQRFKALPEHILDGFGMILEDNPAEYLIITMCLTDLNNMSNRLKTWKQNRLTSLGFELRKLETDYRNQKHRVSLSDAKDIITSKTQAEISDRESELKHIIDLYGVLISLVLGHQIDALQLKLAVRNTIIHSKPVQTNYRKLRNHIREVTKLPS